MPNGFSMAITYTHDQAAPATTWVISHNLNLDGAPIVDCWIDDGGVPTLILPESVTHTDNDTCTIIFSAAQFGTAVLA